MKYIFKIFVKLSLIVNVIFAVPPAFSQDILVDSIRNGFNSFMEKNFYEKIYVHTDRSFYLRDETMWFKIWTVNVADNQPIDLSKVAYIELLDHEYKSVLNGKIALKNGSGDGSFIIPADIPSGNYLFRAYTSFMKNFPPEYYFQQQITIINPQIRPVVLNKKSAIPYQVGFFPEGGNLVHGLETKIGFKANDQTGRGLDYKGYIINSKGDTIIRFVPDKFGMGNFKIKPSSNEKYRAVWMFKDAPAIVNTLPEVYKTGYSIRLIDKNPDYLFMEVKSSSSENSQVNDSLSQSLNLENVEEMLLVAHNNKKIFSQTTNFLSNGTCIFRLAKASLEKGVSCLTLFNSQKKPVCERLYFSIPDDTLQISTLLDTSYNLKSKVTVDIKVEKKSVDSTHSASMSIAVILLDSLQSLPETNISNYLWLTSELKGYVQSPSFYFSESSEAQEALENLLLTQGWRRYNWNDILNRKNSVYQYMPDLEKLYLQAKITYKNSGKPAGGKLAYLSIPSANNYFYTSKSNTEGNIVFPLKNVTGLHEIILQLNSLEDTMSQIELKDNFTKAHSSWFPNHLKASSLSRQDLETRFINANVNFSFHKNETGTPDVAKSPYLFYGAPDITYDLDKYTRFTTMEEVLREYVLEVALRKKNGKYVSYVFDDKTRDYFKDEPLYLLDGLPFFDANQIVKYDPLKIKKIEIIDRKYFLGPSVSHGIVSFFTYKNDLTDFSIDSTAMVFDYKGLEKSREFYAPEYSIDVASKIPDFRNLLYWNPDFSVSEVPEKLEFYSSEQTGNYAIIINGISRNGKTGSVVKTFSVVNREDQ